MTDFGARVISGLGWSAGCRLAGQIVAWIVTIFVMRILNPADYGLLAMAMVLVVFAGLFSGLGLSWAIVQAREIDVPTLRKVYGLIIIVYAGFFALVFFAAPLVAAFFKQEDLTDITRVIALQFLLQSPSVIPDTLLQRGLEFKRRSLIWLSGTIVGGGVTLLLAISNFGIWSLVYGTLAACVWQTVALNVLHPFLHLPSFAFRGLGKLFAFGGYVAVSRFLLQLYLQADTIIGGRLLGKEQIGFYSVGAQLASLPVQRVSVILNNVAFPAFASIQNDPQRVGRYLLQGIRLLSFCSFPIFWGIAAVAPEVVGILLGEKWQPCILPLQLLALIMPVRMIGQLMPPTLQGIGKAKLVARNQLVACIAMITAFLVGAQFGIIGLSMAWVMMFPLVFLINLRTWLPVLGLSARQLLGGMARPALAGAGMSAAVSVARTLDTSHGVFALFLFVGVGVLTYAALSLTINREGIDDLRSLLRRRRPSI